MDTLQASYEQDMYDCNKRENAGWLMDAIFDSIPLLPAARAYVDGKITLNEYLNREAESGLQRSVKIQSSL